MGAGKKSGVVAPRRTVHLDGKAYAPGESIELSEKEEKELRVSGYLVDESAKPAERKPEGSTKVSQTGSGTVSEV